MAFTVVKNLTDISACEATTNWSGSPSTDAALVREGTNCLAAQVSNTTSNFVYTGTPLSGGGVNLTGQRVYLWVAIGGVLDTLANGGLGIILGDGTNQRAYYVGGSDRIPFQVGPWSCLCLDVGNLPSSFTQITGAGAPSITAITAVGLRIKTVAKATGSSPNMRWDMLRYGTGLTIYGGSSGSPETFDQIASDDASVAAGKAYGIIRKVGTGVYEVQGDLTFGDSAGTNTSYFKDSDLVVAVANNVLGAGTNTDIKFTVTGNATGTDRHFELGIAVGSGDTQKGRNGVLFRNENISGQPVVFTASNANIKEVLLYGCSFIGIRKTGTNDAFSSDATNGPNHKLSGCTFDRCGRVDVGRVVVRNCVFQGYIGTNGALLWNANINIKNCQFIANSNASNAAAIEHPASTIDSGAQTISVVAAAKTFTRSAGSFLSDGFVDGGAVTFSGFTNGGNNTTKTIATVTALVITVTDSTGLVDETGNGDEHAKGGSFTYDNLTFSGNDFDVNNTSAVGLTVQNTNAANGSTYEGTLVKFISSVSVSMKVVTTGNAGIQNAQTSIYRTSDNVQILNGDTDVNGDISTSYGGSTPVAIYWRVRKSSTGATKYRSASGSGTIAAGTGFAATVTLYPDSVAN